MIALDEDALICDFAETYHIYDIYSYPVEYIATLASGLRNDSRVKMRCAGMIVDPKTLILARIADNTALNIYAKTKDAQKGRNRPKSMVEALTTEKTDAEKIRQFKTGEDFLKEWNRL